MHFLCVERIFAMKMLGIEVLGWTWFISVLKELNLQSPFWDWSRKLSLSHKLFWGSANIYSTSFWDYLVTDVATQNVKNKIFYTYLIQEYVINHFYTSSCMWEYQKQDSDSTNKWLSVTLADPDPAQLKR